MKFEEQLKLQAFLDGELSGAEAREVGELLARDADAEALLAEMRWTNAAVAASGEAVTVPETREFYWSKIAREIQRQEQPQAEARWSPAVWMRWLMPVSGLAAVAILVSVSTRTDSGAVNETENALEDTSVYTFQSQAEKMNVIWIQSEANQDFNSTAPDAKTERNDNK